MSSHYLNKCLLNTNWVPGNIFEWNCEQSYFHSRKCIGNAVCYTEAILSWSQCVNPLHAKFFRGIINIHLHFMSLLHIDMTQVLITGIAPEAVKWGVDRYDRPLCPGLQPGPPSQTPGGLGQRYWSVSEVTWPPQLELRRWRSSGPSSVMLKSFLM